MIEIDTEAFRSIREMIEEIAKREEEIAYLMNSCDPCDDEEFSELDENDLYGNHYE